MGCGDRLTGGLEPTSLTCSNTGGLDFELGRLPATPLLTGVAELLLIGLVGGL